MSVADSDAFDLLRVRAVRALLLWRGFPYVLQAVFLAVFIALIAVSWGSFPPDGINAKLFAKSHLTTLLIWGIWWPSIIWLTVLFGRVWCMVCPLELISNLAERLGRLIGVPQLAPRRWMISGAIVVALYGLIQLLVAAVHIHRIPAYTAWFLVGLLAFPAIAGLLFKDRTFCRVFCPVGQLLATYGRGGMIAVRASSAEACAACVGKDCLRACNRTKWDGRSCPSLLNPPKLNSNRDCLVCGQCIKSCRPDNMRLLLRRPFHEKDTREPVASWPTTAFVMLVSGFVTWELCAEWPAAEQAFLAIPEHVAEYTSSVTWVSGFLNWSWALILVPLLAWSLLATISRIAARPGTITEQWRRMALPVAVIVSAGHMTKGLAKFVSWAGFLPSALHHPDGLATAIAISANNAAPPQALLSPPSVAVIGIVLIVAGLFVSIREARLADPESQAAPVRFMPGVAVTAVFLAIVCGSGFSP